MPTLLESLLFDPDRYFASFDGDHLAFRTMTRATYRDSIFLDTRMVAADDVTTRAPIEPLLTGVTALRPRALPLLFIFHIAHCGSTLLARALDRDDDLVLREPLALRQLGVLAAAAPDLSPPREWSTIADLACRLLAKRYRPTAPTIIKANVPVNFMVPWLMARQPEVPALFLYLPFEDYLVAILRSESHRAWVMEVTGDLFPALDGIADFGDALEPGRMAAALWLAQMRIYAAALTRHPLSRSLDANVLFERPTETIAAAHALFGLALSPSDLKTLVAGSLFTTYAKAPDLEYDEAVRRTDRADAMAELQDEIVAARAWLLPKLDIYSIPASLPSPLLGEERPLFKGPDLYLNETP